MEEYISLLEGLDISLSKQKLVIEERDYTAKKFRDSFFEIVEENDLSMKLMMVERKDADRFKKITSDIFNTIKNQLKPKLHTGLDEIDGLDKLTPVVSMEEDEVFLINELQDVVSDIKFKPWLKAIDSDLKATILGSPMPMAKFIFDPYDNTKIRRGVVDNGIQDMVFINTFTPPVWGKKDAVKSPFLQEFLKHLFNDNEEQIDYCMDWMAEAVWGRNETYLVLNGAKGVGKNTLYEIMKAVISPKYCVTAPKSLTTSQFNGALKDKRLILLDEYKITRSEHMKLKQIINKYQTIEKKGIDADKETETFNSFMVFHNDISDMYLERDDRRFSVLDITNKNLLDMWSGEEITEYLNELNDPNSDLVASIGYELKEWRDLREFEPTTVLKGDKFHEIVEYHMPTWLQIVVAMIENEEVKNGSISFKKDIEKRLSSEMMGNKKIQWRKRTLEKVLRDYKYRGSWSIGEVTKVEGRGGSLGIQINPDLLEHFGYDSDEDEDDLL